MRAERFKVVSVLDESFTWTMAERLDYAGTRNMEGLRQLPGTKPTIYHVREVPHGLWEEFVDAADNYAEKYRRAFMCGIERVENLCQLDGVTLGTWAPNTKNARSGAVILDDEDLRLFSPAERAEIGSVIYTHSFLPKRIVATYLLPHSLQEPLTSLAVRRVVANPSDAVTKTKSALLVETTPNPDTTAKHTANAGLPSASPTGAGAATQPSP